MLNDYFVYDGVNSKTLGLQLQSFVEVASPNANVTTKKVPGMNGVLNMWDGSYGNRECVANCFVLENYVNDYVSNILQLGFRNSTYRRLELSNDPDCFMMARLESAGDTDVRCGVLAPIKLKFDCKPQKYTKSGEFPLTFSKSGKLYNTGMTALPLITVYGNGSGKIKVGGTAVTINSISSYVTLDCEIQDAYKGLENKNSTISADEFPQLGPGENSISFSGDITKLEITPRWWHL